MNSEIYLRDKNIAKRLDIHRGTVWRLANEGKFPKPIKLSAGVTRWKLSEIEAWEAEQNGGVK